MPSSDAILSAAAAITNDWRWLAGAWHVAIFVAVMVMWATAVAVASLIYGVIGVAALGVWIDVLLVAGAMLLLGTTLRRKIVVRRG